MTSQSNQTMIIPVQISQFLLIKQRNHYQMPPPNILRVASAEEMRLPLAHLTIVAPNCLQTTLQKKT